MIHLLIKYGEFHVWTDCQEDEEDGRELASHICALTALQEAKKELQKDMDQVDKLISEIAER